MDTLKKQDTSTGNGVITTPILAQENVPMEANSTPSPESTSIEFLNFMNARPSTPAEALGLLQTRFSDLQRIGFDILLEGNSDTGRLYVVIGWKGHTLGFEKGHLTADGKPVLKMEPT